MKKLAVLVALLCVIGASAFAEASPTGGAKSDMLIAPGSIVANAGVSFAYSHGFGIGGGAEYSIGKFTIAGKLPFSYGAAARAGIYFGSGLSFGVGALGTLHFSWGALDLPAGLSWMKNLDTYIGLGLDVVPAIGFDEINGFSYFLDKNLAINLEAGIYATYLGVLYKF